MSMITKLFDTALGISAPWHVSNAEFDQQSHCLLISIDFVRGSHFSIPGVEGSHPVHDTVTKEYQHLNFFQHQCILKVRTPRVRLPNGSVRLAEPDFAGRLNGFTLLMEALLVFMASQMTFAAVERSTGVSAFRVDALCKKYVELASEHANYSDLDSLAIDETSRAKGHNYVTLAADTLSRRVVFVTEGKDAQTIEQLASHLSDHKCPPKSIKSVSIDMSPAFISGVTNYLPNAQITFDKFHVIMHASDAVDQTRRIEQRSNPALKGKRWILLKDRSKLKPADRADLDSLISKTRISLTARAWVYKEELREILDRKQINVMSAALRRWCTCVMRSKVEPMKQVAKMIRSHFDGIVSWARSRLNSGFLEAINGLFQAAKRRARGYGRFDTIKTIIFLIAGDLDFKTVNPHVHQPTRN